MDLVFDQSRGQKSDSKWDSFFHQSLGGGGGPGSDRLGFGIAKTSGTACWICDAWFSKVVATRSDLFNVGVSILNFDPKWISFLINVDVSILIQRGSRF